MSCLTDHSAVDSLELIYPAYENFITINFKQIEMPPWTPLLRIYLLDIISLFW